MKVFRKRPRNSQCSINTMPIQVREANSTILKDNTKEENLSVCVTPSFHEAILPVIKFAQFFGVMPISGFQKNNPESLKFSWYSWRLLGTYVFLVWNIIISSLFLKHLLKIGITPRNLVSLVFFTMSELSYFLFLLLARKWPEIIKTWTLKESKFLTPLYATNKFNMLKIIRITATVLGLFALLEHMMFQLADIYSFFDKINNCHFNHTNQFTFFYTTNFGHVFDIIPYNPIIAVMLQMLSFTSTFVWNFMDLFIILVSIGLTARFRQFYERLRRDLTINDHRPKAYFHEIRMDFITLCDLLEYVDKNMSFIILLSCLNNLYFVCYQLMNIVNVLRYIVSYAYFWYSLLYLIGRTVLLFLAAAAINDASKLPADLLRSIPRHGWCEEIDRLLFQLSTETIALTAMGFFNFTRALLFGMAGTIVTYELVILQFNENSRDKILPPLCG